MRLYTLTDKRARTEAQGARLLELAQQYDWTFEEFDRIADLPAPTILGAPGPKVEFDGGRITVERTA